METEDAANVESVKEILGRAIRKLCAAGIFGLTGGVYASMVYAKPLSASCRTGFHGCVILMGYFVVVQESARALREKADFVNSWIAGSGVGFGLSTMNYGKLSGLRTGLYGGLAAGGVHFIHDAFGFRMLRKLLTSWDLLDPLPDTIQEEQNLDDEVDMEEDFVTPWWEWYLPVRRISKKEARERQAMEVLVHKQMLEQMDPPQQRTAELRETLPRQGKSP